jgi:hypothetical protein
MLARVDTALPPAFAAGTTVQYTRSYADYPANDGWTLTLYLAGAQILNKVATASGADFVITLAATDTDDLTTPGLYRWVERASKSGVVKDVASGTVEVTANLATATAGSLQTTEEKLLAAVDAVIAGKITDDVLQYTIAGRSLTLMSRLDLLELRRKLQWDVARQRGKTGRTRRLAFTGTENES